MTADKKDECSQMASDNQLGLSGPGLGAPGLVISTNLPDAIREQMKADPLKRRRSHVEWLDAAELAGALARFPGMMAFDEDEALAVWADIRRAVLSNALADDMFKVTEEVAIDEGGGNLDDALTIELTQAGAKFYLKHGGRVVRHRGSTEDRNPEDAQPATVPAEHGGHVGP